MDARERTAGRERGGLLDALLALRTKDEARAFLEDLLTPAELRAIGERWAVARLVDKGLPYRAIYAKTGVSTATITRVARCVNSGASGYRTLLGRIALKAGS